MMTISQVKNASLKHKYLALRNIDGCLIGVNSMFVQKAIEKCNLKNLTLKTEFIGFKSICFNEYINRKIPFL